MVRKALYVLPALMMSWGLAAAQSNKPNTAATPEVAGSTEAPKVPSTISPDTVGAAVDPKTYVLGPEDIIRISVWREVEMSGAKGIRPDGKITMPLIGDIQASGLTPEQLTGQLKQALIAGGLKQPDVTVEVIQVNSKRFNITGEVNRPGPYPLVMSKTVFEAVNDAGGFREFANKSKILIMRKSGGKPLEFNYNDFIKGKHPEKNVVLENGDTVIVK